MKRTTSVTIMLFLSLFFMGGIIAQKPFIPNNWYRLENGQNKKSMANNGQTNVNAIMIAKSQVNIGGHWKFVPMGNGTFRIQNKHSKMFLANAMKKNSGSRLLQTNNPGPGALWRIKRLQGGYIQIINDNSRMVIGLGGQQDGAPLIQTNQMSGQTTWLPVAVGNNNNNKNFVKITPNVWYYVQNAQSKKSIANNGLKKVGSVIIAKSHVQNGGHWKFIPMGNGTFRVQNRNSMMYLANFQQKNSGAQLKQTNNPGPGALWRIKYMPNGRFRLVNNESKMMMSISNVNEGSPVVQSRAQNASTAWIPLVVGK